MHNQELLVQLPNHFQAVEHFPAETHSASLGLRTGNAWDALFVLPALFPVDFLKERSLVWIRFRFECSEGFGLPRSLPLWRQWRHLTLISSFSYPSRISEWSVFLACWLRARSTSLCWIRTGDIPLGTKSSRSSKAKFVCVQTGGLDDTMPVAHFVRLYSVPHLRYIRKHPCIYFCSCRVVRFAECGMLRVSRLRAVL